LKFDEVVCEVELNDHSFGFLQEKGEKVQGRSPAEAEKL